jgi:DNA-binding NarL/FixJ family response regulator
VTTVLLVEGHTVVRRGIRLLLEAAPDLEVCGGISTLAEAAEVSWDPDVLGADVVVSRGRDSPRATEESCGDRLRQIKPVGLSP